MPLHLGYSRHILRKQGRCLRLPPRPDRRSGFVESEKKKSRWLWPLGLMATGVAGAAVVLFRGCWHRRMSWPIRSQGCSYQVCLGCGIKRLFDEQAFRAYGPFSYDLQQLISWEQARRTRVSPPTPDAERSAS